MEEKVKRKDRPLKDEGTEEEMKQRLKSREMAQRKCFGSISITA